MSMSSPAETPSPPREGEFRIELPEFTGPLDLLLHLIKKHELDILDLPVSFITERYLEYLRVMQELDLELAGEYLVMAATLAHIKSKMLLPQTPDGQQEEGEAAQEQDPRLELIRRLLEYQKYKAVADELGGRAVAGRDVFGRGMNPVDAQGPAPLSEIGLFKLLDAFQTILERTKGRLAFEVTAERMTIQERIAEITERLRERKTCQFEELFDRDLTRYDVVMTFLALLEMTKLRVARIYQADYESPIHVSYALLDASAPTVPPPEDMPAQAQPAATSEADVFEPVAAPVVEKFVEAVAPSEAEGFESTLAEPVEPMFAEPTLVEPVLAEPTMIEAVEPVDEAGTPIADTDDTQAGDEPELPEGSEKT
jgi:segregation and condensation protein A